MLAAAKGYDIISLYYYVSSGSSIYCVINLDALYYPPAVQEYVRTYIYTIHCAHLFLPKLEW